MSDLQDWNPLQSIQSHITLWQQKPLNPSKKSVKYHITSNHNDSLHEKRHNLIIFTNIPPRTNHNQSKLSPYWRVKIAVQTKRYNHKFALKCTERHIEYQRISAILYNPGYQLRSLHINNSTQPVTNSLLFWSLLMLNQTYTYIKTTGKSSKYLMVVKWRAIRRGEWENLIKGHCTFKHLTSKATYCTT